MNDSKTLEIYKALVDDAFVNAPLHIRQSKAASILSEAQKHFPEKEFRKLQDYVFKRLEK